MNMTVYKLAIVVDMQRTLFYVKSQSKLPHHALLLQCYSKLYQWRGLRSELVWTKLMHVLSVFPLTLHLFFFFNTQAK